jgi:hypothetical protein
VNGIRKWIILGTSFGVACALTLAGAYGVWRWYQTRPKSWNSNAIVATFDKVETAPTEDRLIFSYVLHNKTRTDYRLSSKDQVEFMTRLKNPASLMHDDLTDVPANHIQVTRLQDFPVFIPPGEGVPFAVSQFTIFPKGFVDPPVTDPSAYKRETARIANEQLPNIAGFVLFDNASQYRIDLPKGW